MSDPKVADKQRKLSIRSPDELDAMTFPEDHLILGPHLLYKGQNACLVGPGGCGKSRLVLQEATTIIASRKFIGFTTHAPNIRWLVLQAENDNRRLQHDIRKLKRWYSEAEWTKINKQLFIHTLETDEDGFLTLEDLRNRRAIAELIGDYKPDVVSWDALQCFAIGDLNKDRDMWDTLSVISQLTKTGNPLRVPYVLHHSLTGREGAARATGYDRASYGRGSKTLFAWTRLQINLSPDINPESGVVVVSAGKCSDAKEFPDFGIRLNPDTMVYEKDTGFDVKSWRADVMRKNAPLITDSEVSDLCGIDGIAKADLVESIETSTGCAQGTAYRSVERAAKRGYILYVERSDKYVRSNAWKEGVKR